MDCCCIIHVDTVARLHDKSIIFVANTHVVNQHLARQRQYAEFILPGLSLLPLLHIQPEELLPLAIRLHIPTESTTVPEIRSNVAPCSLGQIRAGLHNILGIRLAGRCCDGETRGCRACDIDFRRRNDQRSERPV